MVPEAKKRGLGQYFTREKTWLKENVRDFILKSGCSVAYDPFAGSGHLLKVVQELGISETKGLDIDEEMGWETNDSLLNVPVLKNAIIVTNPPYLSNYSAKRRHILDSVKKYFENTKYDDLYLIALSRMIHAQDYVVAIVPETFINSSFPKERLFSINILEENPFAETETPVCVVCFDSVPKSPLEVRVYKNGHFKSTLGDLEARRLHPGHDVEIRFNSPNGKIGLRAVDTTYPERRISFMRKEELDYDLKSIKTSSRIITVIEMNVGEEKLSNFIETCNLMLEKYREATDDLLLSPFKGNMKNGVRRRRLDYETCRAIMEMAYKYVDVSVKQGNSGQAKISSAVGKETKNARRIEHRLSWSKVVQTPDL